MKVGPVFLLFETDSLSTSCYFTKLVLFSGNVDIGNGYGVPGGGAYRELEKTTAPKDLPEYLKQKLRARGILKEDADVRNTNNASLVKAFLNILS